MIDWNDEGVRATARWLVDAGNELLETMYRENYHGW